MNILRRVLYIILVLVVIGLIAYGIYRGEEIDYGDMIRIALILVGAISGLFGLKGRKRRPLRVYESQFSKELEGAFPYDKKLKSKLLEAVRLYDENKEQKALKILDRLVIKCESRQDYSAVLLFTALCQTDLGMTVKAMSTYQRLLQYHPGNSTAHSNLGLLHTKQGEYRQAVNCFESALKMNPDNPYAYNNLASVYYRMNDYDAAEVYALKCLELKGNMYQAASLLAVIYRRKGDMVKSDRYYRIAVDNGQNRENLLAAMNG